MHHYAFHIGDFRSATTYFSRLERAMYREMLDLLYDTETPLPKDVTRLYRLLAANEQDERDAIDFVLSEKFELTEEGYIDRRVMKEIAKWRKRGWYPCQQPRKRLRADVWIKVRLRIFKRDGYTCVYCGCKNERLECDHFIPISRGGGNEEENLVTACKPCNRKKSNMLPDLFKAKMEIPNV